MVKGALEGLGLGHSMLYLLIHLSNLLFQLSADLLEIKTLAILSLAIPIIKFSKTLLDLQSVVSRETVGALTIALP